MMRRLTKILLVILVAGMPAVSADELPGSRTAGDKLGRGFLNLLTGFLEVPRNIHNTTSEDSILAGWTVGLGKGLGYTVMRMAVGAYEIVTFPFPLPEDYEPVIQPEFVWQAPGPRYK